MALLRYLTQYRVRDMIELIANDKKESLSCSASLKGKTVVLSGATSGIGLETALLLAEKGASLICLNRDPEKSEKLEKECRERFDCDIQTILVDFSSLQQVNRCAEELMEMNKLIDIIIHNSGVFHTKKRLSEDNIEMVFQVNHLSSFMLNYLLKDKLKTENRARILYVNSEGHRFALAGVHVDDLHWRRHFYTGLKSYGAAKTAQLLTMLKFNEYFSDSSVTINAMHPGNVKSNMGNNNGRVYRMMKRILVLPSAKESAISARALYYLAASSDINDVSGKYFNLTTEERPAPHARDYSSIDNVWNKSLELCGLKS